MGYGFVVDLWGDYALFTRPELKVERYSYDVITPSAARGILTSICWKPAIEYKIDRIHVINPIEATNIRRNEVSEIISGTNVFTVMNGGAKSLNISPKDTIQQRASRVLKNVRYIIEAHFEMTDKAGERDSPEKFYSMIRRRLKKGQCYLQPYFGCREFPVKFSLLEDEIPRSHYHGEEKDFGLMLYDFDYGDPEKITPYYFNSVMKDGIIDLQNCEVFR